MYNPDALDPSSVEINVLCALVWLVSYFCYRHIRFLT